MKTILLVLIGLLGLSQIVHAEGGCPPGMIPYSGTDIRSCGPMPPGYEQQTNQSRPQVMTMRWTSKWGAIATDSLGHIAGAASDKQSEQDAKDAAVADCNRYDGKECKVAGTYSNQCIAIVSGDRHTDTVTAKTIDQATEQGMKHCHEKNQNGCHVFYSACSLPKRTQ